MATEKHPCAQPVYSSASYGEYPCARYGRIERDGKWWCTQHDPVAVEARREQRIAKWAAKWKTVRAEQERLTAFRAERDRLADAAEGLLAALKKIASQATQGIDITAPLAGLVLRDIELSARAALAAAEPKREESAHDAQ